LLSRELTDLHSQTFTLLQTQNEATSSQNQSNCVPKKQTKLVL